MTETQGSTVELGVAALPPGARLRAAREQAGWTMERLAGELCLPVDRLRALEADDHASFGGVVYVRGYLRRAAQLFGLPPQELITAFETCCNSARPAEILPTLPPGRPPRRAAPGWPAPVAGMAAVALLAGLTWWWLAPQGERPADVASVAAGPATLEFPPAEPRLPVEPELRAASVEEGTGAGMPGDMQPRLPDSGGSNAAATAPAAASTAAPMSVVMESPRPALRVVEAPDSVMPPPGTAELRFEFSEDCWLEVTDADEQRLAYRLYRAGDVARLRGKAPVSVFLGNAEAVRLTVDGSPIAVRPAARRDGTARLTVGGGAG